MAFLGLSLITHHFRIFFSALLRYNWQIKLLHIQSVINVTVWYFDAHICYERISTVKLTHLSRHVFACCFFFLFILLRMFFSLQFSSVAQSCPTLCDPMNRSMPGLQEFTQTHIHRVRDAIQPSHPRSSPSPPAPNPSQHQSLFQWVNFLHEVAKVLEFQL